MQRWTSPRPLALPIPFDRVARLDLEFVDVRRDSGSFTAWVFLGTDEPPPDAGRDDPRFAGSFTIFAPGECWGSDEGHCDWRKGRVSAFDRRPPHHLAPINVSMEVTDTMRRLDDPDELVLTVHAALRADPEQSENVLRFGSVTALAYQ